MSTAARPQQPPPPAEDPPAEYNAANPQHVAEREKEARNHEALLRSGLRYILANDAGRAYIYRLLERCGIFTTSFTGNSETFMREGQRNIGLIIMDDIHRGHEDAYLLMCREAKARGARGFRPKEFKDKNRPDEEGER